MKAEALAKHVSTDESEAPPVIDPETGAAEESIKKQRKRRTKKVSLNIDPATLALLAPIIAMPFDFTFRRMLAPPLTAEEKKQLGTATVSVLQKYLPYLLTKYKEEIALVVCVGAIVGSRWGDIKNYREQIQIQTPAPSPEAKQQSAAPHVPEFSGALSPPLKDGKFEPNLETEFPGLENKGVSIVE